MFLISCSIVTLGDTGLMVVAAILDVNDSAPSSDTKLLSLYITVRLFPDFPFVSPVDLLLLFFGTALLLVFSTNC